MTRPAADPRGHGFRLSWTSNALLWSASARRLIRRGTFAEVQLGFVAAYLAVSFAVRLLDGTRTVPAEPAVRADRPIQPKALRKTRDRLEKIRDAILHLGDETGSGRHVTVSWKANPPGITLTATVGRRVVREDSITRKEVEDLLRRLDRWLIRHHRRMLKEERARAAEE